MIIMNLFQTCNITAIIVAAGRGQRLSGSEKSSGGSVATPKQFLPLAGKPLIMHTLKRFDLDCVTEVILVLNEDFMDFCKPEDLISVFETVKSVRIVQGAPTRQESVYNGLLSVMPNCDYVLVHDGARPFITEQEVRDIAETVKVHKACIYAVRPIDTIKETQNGFVKQTLDRERLVGVLTPQAFQYDLLLNAYKKAHLDGTLSSYTDDSSIVEATGQPVYICAGSYENFKITTKFDLACAELILSPTAPSL